MDHAGADWGAIRNRMSVKVYGIHDAAKALRDIEKTLSKSR